MIPNIGTNFQISKLNMIFGIKFKLKISQNVGIFAAQWPDNGPRVTLADEARQQTTESVSWTIVQYREDNVSQIGGQKELWLPLIFYCISFLIKCI